jgi:hypothetical protein
VVRSPGGIRETIGFIDGLPNIGFRCAIDRIRDSEIWMPANCSKTTLMVPMVFSVSQVYLRQQQQ